MRRISTTSPSDSFAAPFLEPLLCVPLAILSWMLLAWVLQVFNAVVRRVEIGPVAGFHAGRTRPDECLQHKPVDESVVPFSVPVHPDPQVPIPPLAVTQFVPALANAAAVAA